MGCGGAKAALAADPAFDAHAAVPATWAEVDKRAPTAGADGVLFQPEEGVSKRASLSMDSACIEQILAMMGASREQLTFFDVWAKHVHNPALVNAVPNGKQILISTDLRFLEVRVTAPSSHMRGLLRSFVDKVKDMPNGKMNELNMVLDTLQTCKDVNAHDFTPLLTVWCKIKHCRSDAPPPSVDCGYLINQDLQWAVIDCMMPSHEDQDALREYALSEKHEPLMYGSSILPVEPEKMLGFELHETAAQNSRQILLTAFFFFKTLGLMKPEDSIVRILNTCQCGKLVVTVSIGPEGLVRLALSMIDPKRMEVGKELADELAFQYREKDLKEIYALLQGEPDNIDYVGETKGYGIRLSFIA